MIWMGTEEELREFLTFINDAHDTIKFIVIVIVIVIVIIIIQQADHSLSRFINLGLPQIQTVKKNDCRTVSASCGFHLILVKLV